MHFIKFNPIIIEKLFEKTVSWAFKFHSHSITPNVG